MFQPNFSVKFECIATRYDFNSLCTFICCEYFLQPALVVIFYVVFTLKVID